ncbi:MAG TPA: prolyl oligopeptidase family serine peptidase [Solirubrobacterales bacterium]
MRRWPKASAALAATALSILIAAGCGGGGGGDDDLLPKTVGGAPVSWNVPENHPAGLVILLHGGGWRASDSGYEQQQRNAEVIQDHGYATVAVDYAQGAEGYQQLVEVFKEARRRYPGLPVCAVGISAGGNMALTLATQEPDLHCVIALSAPTDLTTIAQQDPDADEAHKAAVENLGTNLFAKFSPALRADRIRAKVLLIAAANDPVVPAEQSRELARALPGAQLLELPAGPEPAEFAHFGGVQPGAQDTVIDREFDFLKQATQGA